MASKLDGLIKDFNKNHKEQIASKGMIVVETTTIPFSSPRANYMTYGGIPRGKLTEIAGEENGGKTTTSLDVVANGQQLFQVEWEEEIAMLKEIKKPTKTQQNRLAMIEASGPQQVVYADCEHTLDEEWARQLGVDVDSLYLIKPQSQSAEQIFEMLLDMLRTGEVGLMVLDSIGVMISGQAFEKSMEEKTYGGIAQSLTLFSKKAELLCAQYNTTFIGINQMRADMNSAYGGTITTGGKAWRHNCALRLECRKGSYIDDKNNELKRSVENPAGNLVSLSIAKTKVCKPDRRTGFYTLNYTTGIDWVADTVEVAMKYKIINGSGWYTFADLSTGEILEDDQGEIIKIQGKSKVIQYLKDNTWLLEEVTNQIDTLIQ